MKRLKAFLGLLICISLLSGCGMFTSKIPELNDIEHEMVVEYAAETLLQYDKGHGDKVLTKPVNYTIPEPSPSEEPSPEIEEQVEPDAEKTVDDNDINAGVNSVDIIDNTGDTPSSYSTIEGALGLADEVKFEYLGYEIKDSYPDSLESYFVMNATAGNRLLIVRFALNNISDHTVAISMPEKHARFKINLNGTSRNALTTMLLNDMAFIEGTLDAGQATEVVVVGEYQADDLMAVDSLGLTVKLSDGNTTIGLE